MKFLLAALLALAALVVTGTASAGLASIAIRDVPLHGERALAGSPGRFDLVGVRWRGGGSVHFSVRSTSGDWGPWLAAATEEEDQPDLTSPESRATRGWRVGNPTWVGPANGIRYRISGRVRALRASFVRSPELRIPLRAAAVAGAPPIVPRSAWGADESIRRGEPLYAPEIRFASVHHTAGPNDYSPAAAAAIMRGIELYHVKSNGWNDIGYNFLVDRYGTVYEGRYGGIDRNVIGAHIRGFNTGSAGVAVIGTFSTSDIPPAAETALEKLLAWRLDIAHVDPLSTLTFVSGGSERYPSGIPVFLRAVSGHRDTGLTSCPGDRLYARLGEIARAAGGIGLPKVYEPVVVGKLGGPIRFTARVSGPNGWKATVVDALGQVLASAAGRGPTVDWTWDSTVSNGAKGIRWRIEVNGATPATGTIGKPAAEGPLAITGLAADPTTISPNGDGAQDSTTVTFTTTATAQVIAILLDASGAELAELLPTTLLAPGVHTLTFDGAGQPDGVYTIVVTATGTGGVTVSQQAQVAVTRTLGPVTLDPAVISPDGDGKADELSLSFSLASPATVRFRVLRDGAWVATPFNGLLEAGPQTLSWDGSKRLGKARDGSYTAVLDVTDAVATASVSLPFVRDATAPVLRLGLRPPRLWVSEPAVLTIRVNGSRRRVTAVSPGAVSLDGIRRIRSLTAVARDAAGNTSVLRFP